MADKVKKETEAVVSDKDLIVSLQALPDKTLVDISMLHALQEVEQIEKDLVRKQEQDKKDPKEIAHLKDGLVEAKLELEEARKVFNVAKEKEVKIAAIK